MTARDRVFAITELLEQILLNLEPKDALLAQRVSTTFRDTITDSTTIQHMLCFRPGAESPAHDGHNHMVEVRNKKLDGYYVPCPPLAFPPADSRNCLLLSEDRYVSYDEYDVAVPYYLDCRFFLGIDGRSPSQPTLTIFSESQQPLEQYLGTSISSHLEMYLLKTTEPICLIISRFIDYDDILLTQIWKHVELKVRPTTLRKLLGVVVEMWKAAIALENVQIWQYDGEEDGTFEENTFVWQDWVSEETSGLVVEGPTFELMWD